MPNGGNREAMMLNTIMALLVVIFIVIMIFCTIFNIGDSNKGGAEGESFAGGVWAIAIIIFIIIILAAL